MSEIDRIIEKASRKLERIIEREGDADGIRREPWYFSELVCEELRTSEAHETTKGGLQEKQTAAN